MKFLIDRCAGRRLADWLREQGYEVLESQERGIDPGDPTILSWAHAEGRVLVTMDKDFGELIFASGHEHSGVVRLPRGCQRNLERTWRALHLAPIEGRF